MGQFEINNMIFLEMRFLFIKSYYQSSNWFTELC